jgi:hypothetical protein
MTNTSPQHEYLTDLISFTERYIVELNMVEHNAHYYQERLPDTMKSQKDSNQMINNHLDNVIAQLRVNICTYRLMLEKL